MNDNKYWEQLLCKAAKHFTIQQAFVENIISSLIDAVDPRLQPHDDSRRKNCNEKLSPLPQNLASNLADLKLACPLRNVQGTVRNITDFGAFVDFGSENDGLLHVSKVGQKGLGRLMVGREVGVDILGVCADSRRISLSLAGLDFDAADFDKPSAALKKRKGQMHTSHQKATKRYRK